MVDSDNQYDVGDVINPQGENCCHSFEFEKMSDITLDKDRLWLWFGPIIRNGSEYWCLNCQRFLYIVDDETGKILFTANNYTRPEREEADCPFYDELMNFFQTLDKSERPCILDDNEDFIV